MFLIDGQSAADVQASVVTRKERGYSGVLSDYDYRQWSVQRMEAEAARIMRMMNTTYDQVRGGGEGGGDEGICDDVNLKISSRSPGFQKTRLTLTTLSSH